MRRSASADSPRFVGRERELLRVTDALRRRPALVIVEGESGIGKSRLVREALAAVATAGSQALVVACPPFREALTLGPVVDAVRQAVRLDSLTGSGQGLAEQARVGRERRRAGLPPGGVPAVRTAHRGGRGRRRTSGGAAAGHPRGG
ncbi:MAG: AAA family ATPase [Streptomyces sp.]|nr:AAA family ATPase [Streptomyces sp.]